MLTTPGGQGCILLCRVRNMVRDEWAKRVTLSLGMPGKAHWLGSIPLGCWKWWQFTAINFLPKNSGLNDASLICPK
jgi:hypothetical protein